MSKYAFLGLFFTVLVVLMGGLTVNHISSTNAMQEIDVGLESAALGVMRESDGTDYYAPAQDLIAELTAEIAEKQTETGRVIVVSYKFYNKEGDDLTKGKLDKEKEDEFKKILENNSKVYSVQYKVDLYKEGTEVDELDSNGVPTGKKVIPEDAKPQSSTENRISLNQN